MLVIMVLL